MISQRQFEETAAQCISSLVYYVGSGRTDQAKELLAAEVKAIADLVRRWGLDDEVIEECIIHPVETGMVARYRFFEGRKLHAEFAGLFRESCGARAGGRPPRGKTDATPMARIGPERAGGPGAD